MPRATRRIPTHPFTVQQEWAFTPVTLVWLVGDAPTPAALPGASSSPQIALLARAVDIYTTVVGIQHPDTAELMAQLALLYQERGLSRCASPWIRKVSLIFGTLARAVRALLGVVGDGGLQVAATA